MLGSKLSKKAIKHLETNYKAVVINLVATSKKGNPDLIACIKGKFYAFEIKGSTDTEKELQKQKLHNITIAGGFGGFVYCLEDIDNIIKYNKQYVYNKNYIKL